MDWSTWGMGTHPCSWRGWLSFKLLQGGLWDTICESHYRSTWLAFHCLHKQATSNLPGYCLCPALEAITHGRYCSTSSMYSCFVELFFLQYTVLDSIWRWFSRWSSRLIHEGSHLFQRVTYSAGVNRWCIWFRRQAWRFSMKYCISIAIPCAMHLLQCTDVHVCMPVGGCVWGTTFSLNS